MTPQQQLKLTKKIARCMEKRPLPIPRLDSEDIAIVVLDKLIIDWLAENIFPAAGWARDLICREVHKNLSQLGYIIETKPWETDLMATYVKPKNSSPEAKVTVPKWVGH